MHRLMYFLLIAVLAGCSSGRMAYSPNKKYSPAQLQKDYAIYRDLLEETHPSLYWYTTKDSMDRYFDWGRQQLNDSLTENDFRKVLMYVTSKIDCGHTSVRPSKKFSKYQDTARISRLFPLSMKIWEDERTGLDTMVVAANLNRRDSMLKRGTQIVRMNGRTVDEIVDTLFQFIATDGYNRTHKFQSLSNRGNFGALYTMIFGFTNKYEIEYIDSLGQQKQVTIGAFIPKPDTMTRRSMPPPVPVPKPSRRERKLARLNSVRLLKLDSANHTALMDLNSFGKNYKLKKFFRYSFKTLKKHKVEHLIIDVRGNGGGSVNNSTLLTKYFADKPFVIADSLYAITKHKRYQRYVQNDLFNRLFITFFTPKRNDGLYHFRYFEKHAFKPIRKNHYDGKLYILTGGNSFSATTLFTGALIKQENVIVIGEETGGGAYGNSAWLIPDVTLPETKLRFRLPLFRLVIDTTIPKNGRGIQPEVFSGPSVPDVQRGADYKMEKAMEMIKADKREI